MISTAFMETNKKADAKQLGLLAQWREDVSCVFARDPAARSVLEVVVTYPGVHAVLWHRANNRLWKKGRRSLARLCAYLCRVLTNVDIHPGAEIGRRLFIDHGAGVVIGETAVVGNDVTLYHGVTLGGTTWHKVKRHPTLGDNVLVGAGAKILGPITLGNSVRVGANSVVVKDVPNCCTVVGIPGRIIQSKGTKIQNLQGIDLDHHLIPDPVGKAIQCLMDRIDELEAKLVAEKPQLEKLSVAPECKSCEAETLCDQPEKAPLKKVVGM
ncbi:MAG: serine O-acetyltransferase [Gammaproteobacteria bacterium]